MLSQLKDPGPFLLALEKVRDKQRATADDEPMLPGAPRLVQLEHTFPALAARLAREVSQGRYALAPLVPRRARFEGKERVIYHAHPLDKVVLTAMASVLTALLEPGLSPHLHSYRTGRSALCAVREFAAFLRAHQTSHTDPRARGLYVVRRDVKSYGDSIPSGPASPLWPMLRTRLARSETPPSDAGFDWLIGQIRPAVAESALVSPPGSCGIPTGSPLQPLMGNLYLSELDDHLGRIPGGFYARYGDDILFAHPDGARAEAAVAWLDSALAALALRWSADKCEALWLTRAGRPSTRTAFRGTSHVSYLGVRLDATGRVGLGPDKATDLLRHVKQRVNQSARLCLDSSLDERARVLCGVVNACLSPAHPTAERRAPFLLSVVDDYGQLKDLDYRLARLVAERLSRQRGVRAFRQNSMRTLRRRHGLHSLVLARCTRRPKSIAP